jgi:glycerophosphoryl diester phosphodiesterase
MSRFFSSFLARVLPWVVLVHVLIFIAFWMTNRLFYASTNDYLANLLTRRLDYVSLLLWVSVFIGVWCCARIVMVHLGGTHKLAVLSSWLYGCVSLLYILFFYGSFRLLFRESPVQLVRIFQLWMYFRIILDALLVLGYAVLATFWLRNRLRKSAAAEKRRNWGPAILVLLVFGILWSLALFFPPASVMGSQLPDKPLVIAHRGASMLAPENTLVAAQMAVDMGVYGLETDIHVSRDGKLFLLHDDTFDRTTDVRSVFPGREKEPAGNFTLAEISRLNAGKWFLEQDPFHVASQGLLTPEQTREYQRQTVPQLADWLELLRRGGQVFIFDLKHLPADHPYAGSFFELSFEQIHTAGIDPQVWFLVDQEQLQTLRNLAPEMKPAFGADYQSLPPAGVLKDQGYQIVNVEYGISPRWIRQYQDAVLWVNVYTVDEPWQFSRLWLLGVNSVTTSNAQAMLSLERPLLSLPYSLYILVWVVVGLLGLGLIIG